MNAELAVLIQELQRAGVAVAECGQRRGGGGAEPVACAGAQRRRAGFLQQLLVAPLQAAVALAEMHHVAVAVGQHLQLDMARVVEILLDVHRVVAERGTRLGARDAERLLERGGVARHLHAAPAAAGGGLDQHRIADLSGDVARLRDIGNRAVRAGHQRHAELRHRHLGGDLVAHHADMRGRGADEGQAMRLHHLGEAGVLGEEAVAGMDRLGAGHQGGGQDGRDVEVAVLRRRRSDADAFVGQPHVHRIGIRGGVHRDRGNAEFAAGSLDAKRDLAAIGDEDLLEHRCYMRSGEARSSRVMAGPDPAIIPGSSGLRRIPPACCWPPGCARRCRPWAP